MKSWILLSALLLFVARSRSCDGASIGDGMGLEGMDDAGEVIPAEGIVVPDNVEAMALESALPAEDVPALEAEEPKMMEAEELPNGAMDDVFPGDASPVLTEDENCDRPQDFQSVEGVASAAADHDLLKALDGVLAKNETLQDVMRSEGSDIPVSFGGI